MSEAPRELSGRSLVEHAHRVSRHHRALGERARGAAKEHFSHPREVPAPPPPESSQGGGE